MMQLEVDYDKLQRADQELEQLHQDFERIKSRSQQLEATPQPGQKPRMEPAFLRTEKSIDEPSILAQRYAELPSLVQPARTLPVQP